MFPLPEKRREYVCRFLLPLRLKYAQKEDKLPKSIGSHGCMPAWDFFLSELLLTRFTARGNIIDLSGIEGHLPCTYTTLRLTERVPKQAPFL